MAKLMERIDAGDGLDGPAGEGAALAPAPAPAPAPPSRRFVHRGKAVLELGAGTGLLGMSLALGGARVTLTEMRALMPTLEAQLAANARATGARCRAAELTWGQDDDDGGLGAWCDAHAPPGGFELVVGSDLCICAQWADALVGVLARLAARAAPAPLPIVIGSRRTREGFGAMVDGARRAGFVVRELPRAWMDPAFASDEIAVLSFEYAPAAAATSDPPPPAL